MRSSVTFSILVIAIIFYLQKENQEMISIQYTKTIEHLQNQLEQAKMKIDSIELVREKQWKIQKRKCEERAIREYGNGYNNGVFEMTRVLKDSLSKTKEYYNSQYNRLREKHIKCQNEIKLFLREKAVGQGNFGFATPSKTNKKITNSDMEFLHFLLFIGSFILVVLFIQRVIVSKHRRTKWIVSSF